MRRGHIENASGHIAGVSGHIAGASGHIAGASGHIAGVSGHIAGVSGHIASASGHIVCVLVVVSRWRLFRRDRTSHIWRPGLSLLGFLRAGITGVCPYSVSDGSLCGEL